MSGGRIAGWTASRRRLAMLVGLTLLVGVAIFLQPRISQDVTYHRFADQRTLLGVPNFVNVASNAPFALVGVLGLSFLLWRRASRVGGVFVDPRERRFYLVFFLGAGLTSLGSAYYHWAPDNTRLVWDRLPMTLAFMSLFAAVIAERISVRWGLALLWPFVAVGVGSVLYWHATELGGMGDLRPYLLIQFYPMLAIPVILAWFPARYTQGAAFITVLGLYGAAKVLELLDAAVLRWGHVVSGHALKHLTAAIACYSILRMLETRRPVVPPLPQAAPGPRMRPAPAPHARGKAPRKIGSWKSRGSAILVSTKEVRAMMQRFVVVPLVVGAVLLTVGCATKKFVREEVQKSEAKLEQQVGKVETDVGQEKARLSTVTTEVTQVRGIATEATKRADQATDMASQAGTKAEEATGRAGQAIAKADEASGKAGEAIGKAGQALTKADETDNRLTRLWVSRNKRTLVETVVINFGFDKWELDDRGQTTLLDVVKQIQGNPNLFVDLEGYTDSMGPVPYNVQLSQRRAEAVRRFLVEQGVDLNRIQSIGLGTARPMADNKTKQGRDQNRRVAVKVFAPTD